METPTLVRHAAVVGHLGHGKTLLMDVLVGQSRCALWEETSIYKNNCRCVGRLRRGEQSALASLFAPQSPLFGARGALGIINGISSFTYSDPRT